jgi:mono/diheme cytochrome c family protein
MRSVRWWGLPAVAAVVALPLIGSALTFSHPSTPAPTSPPAQVAAAQSSCVACHTSRAALERLVPPLPPPPAEGEG